MKKNKPDSMKKPAKINHKKDIADKTRKLNLLNKKLQQANKLLKEKSQNLATANQKIKVLNRSLKAKVENRTHELQLANEEILTLYTIGKKIVSTLDLNEVLDVIVKTVTMMVGSDASLVRLVDESKKNLVLKVAHGANPAFEENCKTIELRSIMVSIVEYNTPVTISDIAASTREPFKDELLHEGFSSMLTVPIVFNDELLGVITTLSRRLRTFIDSEVSLLQAFASQAAIAINNARLHENVYLNYYHTINTLSLAMEARDPYTRGHSERVTNYALAIAKSLHLSREDLGVIKYAGKVHDIGKIAISDIILLKPGKLTPMERAQVELHPAKGVEIISSLRFLEPGIPIIKHHHERFDGSGYPDGLRENEIPLGARILSVADAFDAMTSERPYRSALAFEEAVSDLHRNAGKQFDPAIVNTFIETISQGLPS